MEALNLPPVYPGNRYSCTITIPGIIDPASVIVRLYHSRGGRPHLLQPTFNVSKTPGARSQDISFAFDDTLKLPVRGYIELWADDQIVRAGLLVVSR